MKMMKHIAAGALAGLVAATAPAMAQDWPTQPVKIIVPFGAGGAADTLARTVADELGRSLGQQFIVENVTGAGGIIALTQLAQAAPDGYTFGVNNISTTVIAPFMNDAVTYDPLADFDYVALLGGSPTIWIADPKLGIKTVDELKALVESSSAPVVYGSPGVGTLSHLVAQKFWADTGLAVEHVPYKGADLAMLDVVGGHIPFASGTFSTAKTYVDSGQVVPLAVTLPERDPAYPDIPTFAELGHPELTSTTWFGLIAPAGVDPAVVDKLNAEVNRILDLENVKAILEPQDLKGERLSPAEFRQYQIDQSEVFGPVAKAAASE
jgi:tripartite-type tricarboxylate transporter receptor subunit TctC